MNKTISETDAIRSLSLYREAIRSIDNITGALIRREFEEFTERAIANLPLSSNAVDGGYTSEERTAYEQARQMLVESIVINPYFPASHFALANANLELNGDDQSALAGYTESLRLDPNDGDVLCVKIWHLIRLGELQKARSELGNLEQIGHRHYHNLNAELSELESVR